MKKFNVAGPCVPEKHYMVAAVPRLEEARTHIEDHSYFVVHAPRQSGKTTTLMALAREMTAEGRMAVLHLSCEPANAVGDDYAAAEKLVWHGIVENARVSLPQELRPQPAVPAPEGGLLLANLAEWARRCPKPLGLVLDEIDSVKGASLISVLRQLRAGYPNRPGSFPASIVLCGMRDVRDYKAASGGDPSRLGTSSPFNVKVKSMKLGNFTREQVAQLYGQHGKETGQEFLPDAVELGYGLTRGQPWLVNALAREVVEEMRVPARVAITVAHIEEAKERLILARATHLDSLVERLREIPVRRVMEPVIAGTFAGGDTYNDVVQYVRDLGLLTDTRPVEVANPIYREVIVRVLASAAEDGLRLDVPRFVTAEGRLDMRVMLGDFLKFWRRNGDILAGKMPYHEVAPQLVLMAWLQRVVNGGGYVEREYGVGRGRIDLLVRWPIAKSEVGSRKSEVEGSGGRRLPEGGWQEEAVELKVWAPGRPDPLEEGLEQIDEYLKRLSLPGGCLVIFDRRHESNPEQRTLGFEEALSPSGRRIVLMRA